ncbi:MAG: tRNA (N6-isopentenyl adenosine(37)-C2)-methylthiotransferase MiaB [Lachnospiraceae bacterium]|nr:tRNA (N6-isopentenyl adenosine(37)-C2)-methylthiotransferase MiaB [Lachnospiraceae bacterium]
MKYWDFDTIYRQAPASEPERQYYFIEKTREILQDKFNDDVISGEARKRYGKEKLDELLAKKQIGTFMIRTFGCQMNARDSEKLCGILQQAGLAASEEETADFVLYNTCTVRDNANQKVYGHLGYLQTLKKKNPWMTIALCGCMMQEPAVVQRIQKSYRFVDLIFGTHNIFKLAELLFRCLAEKNTIVDIWESTDQVVEDLPAERKYPFKSGVNIMYGCNNFCSYCIVPYVRGRERSRKPEEILSEIRRLASDGVKEVMLLGQNVNSYGKNLSEPVTFAELLRQVNEVEGIERIRFMTSHPKDLSEDLILAMKNLPKICRHLHLPLQSGSSRILKIMNRQYTKEQYLELVAQIRQAVPDISLTTDIIVGFPGETEADFEETLDVVRKVRYDSAFTFIYSKRTGTPASVMDNQVPEALVKERFERLLKEVQQISSQVCGRDTGTVQEVLVECENDHQDGYVSGRLSNNLLVHFPGSASLIGSLVPVELTESKGFYYMGRMADKS